MKDQKQLLHSIELQLEEEEQRHARVMQSIKLQVRLALGEAEPRPQVMELKSPSGKTRKVKYIGL